MDIDESNLPTHHRDNLIKLRAVIKVQQITLNTGGTVLFFIIVPLLALLWSEVAATVIVVATLVLYFYLNNRLTTDLFSYELALEYLFSSKRERGTSFDDFVRPRYEDTLYQITKRYHL